MKSEPKETSEAVPFSFRTSTLQDKLCLLIELVLLGICVCGVIVSVRMNGIGRSLWVDEAMLASSFSKRSFFGIVTGGEFEYLQSAPLGWILLEKLATKLLGNTESILRLWSIIFYVLSTVALFFLSKYEFGFRHVLLGSAIFANTALVLEYSNMFKPYISDCFFALLICCFFSLWLNGKIRTSLFTCALAMLLWFSQPACFVEGGFVLAVLVHSLLRKDRARAKEAFVIGAVICISFIAYYLFWVRRMTSVSTMREWWKGQYLSILFEFPGGIGRMWEMIKARFLPFGSLHGLIMIGFVYGSIRAFQTEQLTIMGAVGGLLAACFASLLNFYPMTDRLWLFSFPLILLVALFGFFDLFRRIDGNALYAADVGALCIVLMCTGISLYSKPEKAYRNNQEMNVELAHLSEHILPDDTVYVCLQARPAFEYANGYGNHVFGGGKKDNVIFGEANFRPGEGARIDGLVFRPKTKPSEDVKTILGLEEAWIVCSHIPEQESRQLVDPLLREGYLELVSYDYKTPLYHWCKNASKCQAQVALEVGEQGSTSDDVVVTIKNVGKTYVGTQFEQLYLEDTETGQRYRVGPMIAPGKESRVTVTRSNSGAHAYALITEASRVCGNVQVTVG